MSRKSAQRFCDNDMRRNKNLKRSEQTWRSRCALSRQRRARYLNNRSAPSARRHQAFRERP
ncbi:hypothetical protein C6558_07535 [Ensifer sp. NM-2]|nr:hypothetical protein [Ensifer canadensis]PSS65252.1 hypothetical protein C6558_07535 [Ensifer sp. NM-2]